MNCPPEDTAERVRRAVALRHEKDLESLGTAALGPLLEEFRSPEGTEEWVEELLLKIGGEDVAAEVVSKSVPELIYKIESKNHYGTAQGAVERLSELVRSFGAQLPEQTLYQISRLENRDLSSPDDFNVVWCNQLRELALSELKRRGLEPS